jgi:hypothetical protein
VVQAPPKTTSNKLPETHQQTHIGKSHWTATPKHEWCKHHQKQRQTHCPTSTNKNTLENRIEQPRWKMSGAAPPKTTSKTLPEIQPNKNTLNTRTGKPHRQMNGAHTTNNNLKKHCPKSTNKNTLKHRIVEPHRNMKGANTTKQHHQKHCPTSTDKNTLNNRIVKPHRKMSGASTIKNNLKHIARNPPTTAH